MKTTFKAEQFVGMEFSTIEDKARFANHFMAFIESDFAEAKFPRWFYLQLSSSFGHIAHYNQGGFFEEFFTSLAGKIEFIEQTLEYPAYGDPTYTYSDVEKELKKAVAATGILGKLKAEVARQIETRERDTLARLKEKYEGGAK